MNRFLAVARIALPGAAGITGLVIGLQGLPGSGWFFAATSGLTLGLTIYALLASQALLFGQWREPAASLERHLRHLESEKQIVLRSIKELELDARLQQSSPEQLEALAEPLRQRAMRIMRELDEGQLLEGRSVTEQIEHEVRRRRLLLQDS